MTSFKLTFLYYNTYNTTVRIINIKGGNKVKKLMLFLTAIMFVFVAACSGDVEVDYVRISTGLVELEPGETETVEAELVPSDAVGEITWISQNTSVATVEDGTITAVAAGVTTVTVAAGDDRAYIEVRVTEPVDPDPDPDPDPEPVGQYKPGIHFGTDGADDNTIHAVVAVDNDGYLEYMLIDSVYVSGDNVTTKRSLDDGCEYRMHLSDEYCTPVEGKLLWHQQVDRLAADIVEAQEIPEYAMDGTKFDSSADDIVAGVTINVDGYIAAATMALEAALLADDETPSDYVNDSLPDEGDYLPGLHLGYTEGHRNTYAALYVNGAGVMQDLFIDSVYENGDTNTTKRSMDGGCEYRMHLSDEYCTPTEGNLLWHQQVDLIIADVLENQEIPTYAFDGTKFDAEADDTIAGVTINVDAYLDATDMAIKRASYGEYTPGLHFGTDEDEDTTTHAVVAVNEQGHIEYVFIDSVYVSGDDTITKRTLDGGCGYRMHLSDEYCTPTEGNLLWHQQVDLLAEDIVKHQEMPSYTMDGTKFDATADDIVAGVTINVDGYIAAVEMALEEAGLEDGEHPTDFTEDYPLEGSYEPGLYFGYTEGHRNTYSLTYIAQDGFIQDVFIDSVYVNGDTHTTKRSMDGGCEYRMHLSDEYCTPTEGNLLWHQQVDRLEADILEHQMIPVYSMDGTKLDQDADDAVAGVTINVDAYIAATDMALKQSYYGEYTPGLHFGDDDDEASTTHAVIAVDERGFITDIFIDSVYTSGENVTTKRSLADGCGYKMHLDQEATEPCTPTEGNLLWHQQVDLVIEDVLENQEVIDYTFNDTKFDLDADDAVAGVTINVDAYLAATEMALTRALPEAE